MVGKSKQVAVAERAANRARWAQELTRWRKSGQPLSVWAREQGLSRDALEYWKRKLHHKPAGSLALIPVAMPAVQGTSGVPAPPAATVMPAEAAPIELLFGARRLVLPPGFDGDTLRRAIAVLETC